MPDYYFFHQNMHVFDGSNSKQNERFCNAIQTISGYLNQNRVVAAGFTEIMNTKAPTVSVLNKMAFLLDPKQVSKGLFATGFKLVPDKTAEYISISVHSEFRVEARGRVMLTQQSNTKPTWTCISDQEVPIGDIPQDFVPDSRGLAYVCGQFGDQKMIVGFTHNISSTGYNDTYKLLADIMQLIWARHSDYDGYPTTFGGDFFFAPRAVTKPLYTAYAVAPHAAAETGSNNVPLKTTGGASYDFWVTDWEITNDYAFAYKETWSALLSDHAGIALRLNAEINFGA